MFISLKVLRRFFKWLTYKLKEKEEIWVASEFLFGLLLCFGGAWNHSAHAKLYHRVKFMPTSVTLTSVLFFASWPIETSLPEPRQLTQYLLSLSFNYLPPLTFLDLPHERKWIEIPVLPLLFPQRPFSPIWTVLSLAFVWDNCQANVGEVLCLPDKGCFIPVLTGLTSREEL